jgi:hypothetical protein
LYADCKIKKFSSFGQNMHAIDGWNRLDKTIAMVLAATSESALPAQQVRVKMKIEGLCLGRKSCAQSTW